MAEMDAETQSAFDAAVANANRCEQVGDHAGRAAAATAALKLKEAAYRPTPSATPTDAAGAGARLAHLEKDAAWRARYFAGDAQARQEFRALTTMLSADPVSLAAQGITPPSEVDENNGAVAGGPELVAAFDHFRGMGEMTTEQDTAILEGFMRDRKYDAAEFALAEQVHTELTNDPKFLEKLKSGDPFTQKMFLRTSMVLAAGADPSLPNNPETLRLLHERWNARYQGGKLT
jgi:hypothetical protein